MLLISGAEEAKKHVRPFGELPRQAQAAGQGEMAPGAAGAHQPPAPSCTAPRVAVR